MDTNALRPEFGSEVSDHAFKCCFGDAHDIVVLNDHLAAVYVIVKRLPPLLISGSARWAMRMNVQQDTSMVVRKPSRDTSMTRPCSASLGEKAMECTRKSSLPHSLVMRSNTASICPGAFTSSGIIIGASSSRASGSTYFFALSLR